MQRATKFKGVTPDGVHHFESRPVPALRTEGEIQAQLEARFAELQKQAVQKAHSCEACRFSTGSGTYTRCYNPLIKGFASRGPWAFDCGDGSGEVLCALCGPEKALWRPKLVLWQRLYNWFVDPFGWEKF